MKNKLYFFLAIAGFCSLVVLMVSCEKDFVAPIAPGVAPVTPASFVEQFNNVGDLSAKGWLFKNNSNPIGQAGWRQGRYESASQVQAKFLAPVPYLGFPAYNASISKRFC
jgi:hypothetical protein